MELRDRDRITGDHAAFSRLGERGSRRRRAGRRSAPHSPARMPDRILYSALLLQHAHWLRNTRQGPAPPARELEARRQELLPLELQNPGQGQALGDGPEGQAWLAALWQNCSQTCHLFRIHDGLSPFVRGSSSGRGGQGPRLRVVCTIHPSLKDGRPLAKSGQSTTIALFGCTTKPNASRQRRKRKRAEQAAWMAAVLVQG